jgi:hypothetical protein
MMRNMRIWLGLALCVMAAAVAFLLWPERGAATHEDSENQAREAAQARQAGRLDGVSGAGDLERGAVAGTLLIRVLDAAGRPIGATIHARVNDEPQRFEARDGLAHLAPPFHECTAVAESAGAWSEPATWREADGAPREIVLRLGETIAATLRVRVSMAGEGAAPAPRARLADVVRRGGMVEYFENLEFRDDFAARYEVPASPLREAPAAARARLQRDGFAERNWEGKDGVIEITDLLPGTWSFEVTHSGCAPEYTNADLPPGGAAEIEVTLQRAGSVAGRVLGPDGKPAAGARVALWTRRDAEVPWMDPLSDFQRYGRMPRMIPEHHRALCGPDGTFTIPVAKPGRHDVLAAADELRPGIGGPVDVTAAAPSDAGVLTLARGHALRVEVRNAGGGPIADARVAWRAGESLIASLTSGAAALTTDRAGDVVLAGLPAGEIEATVEAAGCARAREQFIFDDPPAREPRIWQVTLSAGATLPGSVSAGGFPVADALVRVVPPRAAGQILPGVALAIELTTSKPDGSFLLEHLPVGSLHVEIEHPDHAPFVSESLTLAEGGNPPLLAQLSRGATLRVTVQDQNGQPVPDAMITATEPNLQQVANERTGPDGVAILPHLRPGDWQVMQIEMNSPQALENLDFGMRFVYVTLAEGGYEEIVLGGRVAVANIEGLITMSGLPQPGKMVMLIGPGGMQSGRTDATGSYRLQNVQVGEYVVTVAAGLGGGSSWTDGLLVPDAGVLRHDIALPSSAVEVRVVDAATGTPEAGVPVNLRPADSSSISGGQFQPTSAEGVARFEMLKAGAYLAAVGNFTMPMLGGGEGKGSLMLRDIIVTSEDAGTLVVEARLPSPARLRVRVTGTDGSYVSGAHVFCMDESGHALNLISLKATNAKGVVELTGLPPGPRRCVVRHPELGRAEFEVILQAGELVKQEVVLQTGVHLTIEVASAAGKPLPGVLVVVLDERRRPVNYMWSLEETTAVQRSFMTGDAQRVGPLLPGAYTVQLVRPGHASEEHAVTVAPAPAEQYLRLQVAGK